MLSQIRRLPFSIVFLLTMEATFDGADGDATLRMEDSDGNLLGEVTGSDGHLRIDHPEALSGGTYELQISGTNSSVDLRLFLFWMPWPPVAPTAEVTLDDKSEIHRHTTFPQFCR